MDVIASDFASIADLAAYQQAKAKGLSDAQAFKVGDNGRGCFGALTAQEETPMCALPPDDMVEKFGSILKAKNARVRVTVGKRSVVCILADRMPWKRHIKNGCGIDLNPAALTALGLKSPVRIAASWAWL